jgi:hypothetical protein
MHIDGLSLVHSSRRKITFKELSFHTAVTIIIFLNCYIFEPYYITSGN